MKVFVTGATGYIGRPVARAFRRAGHEVSGLARTPEKARGLAAEEIRPILGTLEDASTFAPAAAEADVVVHAAADPGAAMYALEGATLPALLAAARRGPVPAAVIYTSGTWVYGDTGGRRVDETFPLNPPAYAVQRIAHERWVREAPGIRGIVLRPGCVYGRQGSLTAMWFDGAARGELEMVGDGSARWPLVHQDDLAGAYVLAAETGRPGEVFNVAESSSPTVRDMVAAVVRVTGYAGEIRRRSVTEAVARLGPFAECLAYDQQLDAEKAERELGWRPRHGGFVDEAGAGFEAWKAAQER